MFINKRGRKKDSDSQFRSDQLQDGKLQRKHSDNADASRNSRAIPRQPISANDISESYIQLPSEMPRLTKDDSKQMKANKLRIPFLMRKKKSVDGIIPYKVNNDDDLDNECEDVVSYEDVSDSRTMHGIDHNSLNPLMLAELKNLKRANEGLKVDESYNGRVDYITNHYRRPPPYPGYPYQDSSNDGNPSMIQQLLHEQRLAVTSKDNASMLNYCPVEKSAGLSNEDLTRIMKLFPKDRIDFQNQRDNEQSHDGLVLSTEDRHGKVSDESIPGIMNSIPSAHISREQLNHSNNELDSVLHYGDLSELYPRDYEGTSHLPPPDYRDDPDYDNDLRGHQFSKASISPSSLSSRFDSSQIGQPASYVPPSPYLNAEIPDWLQVYSKASQDLDTYLKWDMFRYPELDCWQTMLKRLYKKELEQIVLWFEEYRQALQKEIERRSISRRSMGLNAILPPNRIKKTEV